MESRIFSGNVDLNPGQAAIVAQATAADVGDRDVYLRSLGMDFDPISNEDYMTFRLRVNGDPFYPYNHMTTLFGSIQQRSSFARPIKLGHGCAVDIYAEIGSGAIGASTCAAAFELLFTEPGKSLEGG